MTYKDRILEPVRDVLEEIDDISNPDLKNKALLSVSNALDTAREELNEIEVNVPYYDIQAVFDRVITVIYNKGE